MNEQVQSRTARETIRKNSGLKDFHFIKLLLDVIREQVKEMQTEIDAMKQALVVIEDSSLRLHRSGRGVHFGYVPKGGVEQSTSDLARVDALSRRQYLESQIALLQSLVLRLSKALDAAELGKKMDRCNTRLRRFEEAGIDLRKVLFTKEQNEWIDAPYTPNPFHIESLKFCTDGGVWMRSKSERQLGNTLEKLGIPYRYDDLVTFGEPLFGGRKYDKPYRDTYFADFKVVNFCAGITIHEHLGAFQIEQYADNALYRLNDYRNFEIKELPGKTVHPSEITWSFEGDLLERDLFRRLLRRIIFPMQM